MRNCDLITMLIKKTTIGLLIFILVLSIASCEQKQVQPKWKPTETAHHVADNSLAKMLWSRENVYIESSVFLGLATSKDKVFMLGSTDVDESSKLNALNVFTGELVWKSEMRPFFTALAGEDGVYVEGAGTGGNVTKFDPDTGEVLWSKDFWDSGGVLHLIVYDGELHAYLSPDKHKILRTSDGKTVLSLRPKNPPFFDSRICGIPYQTPIYTSDTIYYRENDSSFKGEICAADISTGKLKWKSDLSVISNVVVSNSAVFVLIESGDLLVLDPTNGKKLPDLTVSFDNKPFILSSVHTTSGSFFLAYNAQNDILLVYLGDSRQLYAFHIQ